ncbi:MAG TPA: class II aldolase/adducin family protein [Anaerovoracaceae bacterium]|nr:class II aldolase/adducin family protein [Anaerovoracaceae bacterium]
MISVAENILREEDARQQLVEYGNKLVATGLVRGTWGNLSIRLDDKYMLVTPSGLDYTRLTADDMVKVNIETLEYGGDLKPTSEKGLHAIIYRLRPDVGAVIHTHSKYCSIFAAARKPMPIITDKGKAVFGEEIAIAGYGLPGTKSLMNNTAKALGKNFGAIMANHGMICCGSDIENTFSNCVMLEECGKAYIEK